MITAIVLKTVVLGLCSRGSHRWKTRFIWFSIDGINDSISNWKVRWDRVFSPLAVPEKSVLLPIFCSNNRDLASLCFLSKAKKQKKKLMVVGVCPAYLPNIHYMAWVVSQKSSFDNENLPKQTFRNRTEITVPTES